MGPVPGRLLHLPRDRASCTRVDRLDGAEADRVAAHFLQERWKGVWPILYGDQLRQARLDDWIFQGVLDVEHLPASRARRRGGDRAGGVMRRDVIVAGAGLAGLTAAVRLAEAGARVLVLAKGVGATHLVAAARSTCSATRPSGSSARCAALARLRRGQPDHPYALHRRGGDRRGARVVRATAWPTRYPYTGGARARTCCCRPRSAR